MAKIFPASSHDSFTATPLAIQEAGQLEESYTFMLRRDALLNACSHMHKALGVDRLRLYEYVTSADSGPFFRGLVEIGGIYANFIKLELPLAADWYSSRTAEHRSPGEPLLFPLSGAKHLPARYLPSAFWREHFADKWADILLVDKGQIVGKISFDNYFHPDKPLPKKAGQCRNELEALLAALKEKPESIKPAEAVEAHRRRVLLNDLTEILQTMVNQLDVDRARAYEYNPRTHEFEARAEVGGTADPFFSSFKGFFHLSNGRDDPVSMVTYTYAKPRVYQRGETIDFDGPHGKEPLPILFQSDDKLGSAGVEYLLDIPLLTSKDKVVGKITIDNKFRQAAREDHGLDVLLETEEDKVALFAEMAASAIMRANMLAGEFGWWERFILRHRGWNDRTWTMIITIAVAIVSGAASGLAVAIFRGFGVIP